MKLFGPSLWSRLAAFLAMKKFTTNAALEFGERAGVERLPYEAKSISVTIGDDRIEGVERFGVLRSAFEREQRRAEVRREGAWTVPLFFMAPRALSPREERIAAAERKRQRKRAMRLARRGAS